MIVLKDSIFKDVLQFFDDCEFHGKDIAVTVDPVALAEMDSGKGTVAYEARLLKSLFLRLYD